MLDRVHVRPVVLYTILWGARVPAWCAPDPVGWWAMGAMVGPRAYALYSIQYTI